jgi:LCP family protein required for cell wall assembly
MQTTTTRRRRRSTYEAVPHWLTPKRVVLIVVLLIVSIVGIYAARVVLSLSHIFNQSPASVIRTILPGGHDDSAIGRQLAAGKRLNIALYGYGGVGHDGPFLTDSIMVVSVQPRGAGQKPQIAEVSIPRDWWVPIDLGNGRNAISRINEAYSSGQIGAPFKSPVYNGDHGGGRMADATLERMLGVHIDYFVGVDFNAFTSAVDAVGGVDITVQHTFTDTKYPRGECGGDHPDCAYMTIHFDAGPQHMDGARALIYARSRESSDPQEGSNFARNKRQQLVLTAVKQKVLSIGGLRNLPDLLSSLGDHVITDMGLDDALSLYDAVKDVDPAAIAHISIDDNNFIYECGYPVHCDAAVEYPYDRTFESVHHFVQSALVDPPILAEKVPITVIDAGGRKNTASLRWTQLLGMLGFLASDGHTAKTSATTHVIDASGGKGTKTAAWLASYFGVTVEAPTATATTTAGRSTATATAPPTPQGITLILGQDEERTFNNPSPGLYGGR